MLHRHPDLESRHCIPDNHVIVDREEYEAAVRRLASPMCLTLSKRNLLTLLHKLEMPGSQRTIIKPTPEGRAIVSVISDEEAYRNRAPGEMHPDTETFIRDVETALAVVRQARAARCRAKDCGGCCGR